MWQTAIFYESKFVKCQAWQLVRETLDIEWILICMSRHARKSSTYRRPSEVPEYLRVSKLQDSRFNELEPPVNMLGFFLGSMYRLSDLFRFLLFVFFFLSSETERKTSGILGDKQRQWLENPCSQQNLRNNAGFRQNSRRRGFHECKITARLGIADKQASEQGLGWNEQGSQWDKKNNNMSQHNKQILVLSWLESSLHIYCKSKSTNVGLQNHMRMSIKPPRLTVAGKHIVSLKICPAVHPPAAKTILATFHCQCVSSCCHHITDSFNIPFTVHLTQQWSVMYKWLHTISHPKE